MTGAKQVSTTEPYSLIAALFLLNVFAFGMSSSPAFAKDNCGISPEMYMRTEPSQREPLLDTAVSRGDACLPLFEKLASASAKGPHTDYEKILSAVARVGTEKAASLLEDEAYKRKKIVDCGLAMKSLAGMGRTGVRHLIVISTRKELSFSKALVPFIGHTYEAAKARDAIMLVSDPSAAADLGAVLDTWVRPSALRALRTIRAPGFEKQALDIWNKSVWPRDRGYALGYLLSVDRTKYLPLLQRELRSFDAEVERLIRENPVLGANGERNFVSDDLLSIVLYAGGDPETALSLSRFADSGLWSGHDEQLFLSVLALGLSRSPAAKATLFHFLKEDLLIKAELDGLAGTFSYEHPLWPRFNHYERGVNKNEGFPVCAVAAIALGELGDAAAIPAIEEAARNNPDLNDVFMVAINMLRK